MLFHFFYSLCLSLLRNKYTFTKNISTKPQREFFAFELKKNNLYLAFSIWFNKWYWLSYIFIFSFYDCHNHFLVPHLPRFLFFFVDYIYDIERGNESTRYRPTTIGCSLLDEPNVRLNALQAEYLARTRIKRIDYGFAAFKRRRLSCSLHFCALSVLGRGTVVHTFVYTRICNYALSFSSTAWIRNIETNNLT